MKAKIFTLILVAMTTQIMACSPINFQNSPQEIVQSSSVEPLVVQPSPEPSSNMEISEISSGGGIALAEDGSFQAEVVIGSVVYQQPDSNENLTTQVGLWNILSAVL